MRIPNILEREGPRLGGEGLSLMGLQWLGDPPISGPRPQVPYVLHRRAAPIGPLSRHLPAHSLCSHSQSGGALQAGMAGGPRAHPAQLQKALGMPLQNRSSLPPPIQVPRLGARHPWSQWLDTPTLSGAGTCVFLLHKPHLIGGSPTCPSG